MNLQVGVSLETRPTSVRYQVLGWTCALSMLTYIDRVCIKSVQDDIASALALSPTQIATIFSAFGLAYALFEVPTGWLGDRFGPRKVLTRIVLWWSGFTALTGLVWHFSLDSGYVIRLWGDWQIPLLFDSFVLLVLIRFLFGAGEAGAYPNIARALRNWFPFGRRGISQGLPWLFARWGGAIAAPLLWIASIPFGWRGAFVIFGVLGMIWVIAFRHYFRNTPAEHPRVNDAERALILEHRPVQEQPAPLSWRHMLRSPNLWFLSLMYFCSNAGWCFFITFDVKYFETVLGLQKESGGWLLASGAPLFCGGIACILGGLVTDRQVHIWGRRWGRTLQGAVAYALGAAFFFLATFTVDPFWAVGSLCIASFLKDFAMACSWSTCVDIGHRYSGTVSGFMNMIGNFGTVVGPQVVVRLAGRDNWMAALYFSSAMFLIAAIGWLFINPKRVIVYAPADHERLRADGVL
jgi:MFS family permease